MNFLKKWLLALWVLFFIATSAFWILKNNLPPAWDEAHYLMGSEILRQTLETHGFLAFLLNTTTILGTKAPLITILPIPLYAVLGSSYHSAMIINLVFAFLFFFYFYKLVSMILDERIALFSCIVVSTMPLFYGLERYYFVEFGLMALVVLWIYIALKTNNLKNKRQIFFLGAVSGLGVLMKFHFFLFIAGPAVFVIFSIWKKNRKALYDIKNFLLFFLPACTLALPWYLRNILTVLWKAKRSTDPALLGSLYYGPPFSVNNLYRSALDFINYSISPYWFLILLVLLAAFFLKNNRLKINYLLSSWFLIPFLIFYLGPNKDYRLMLPLLPPVAVFIGYLFVKIYQKNLYLLFALLLVVPTLMYLNTSVFKSELFMSRANIGPFIFAGNQIGSYVKAPDSRKWPVEDTLRFINSQAAGNKIITLASENEEYNINGLQYYSLLDLLPLKIQTVAYFPEGTSYQTIRETIDQGNYLLMKTGGTAGPNDLNRFNALILYNLDNHVWRELSNAVTLPDGGKIRIWQKIS